ncbi:hypothetical protein HCN44_009960 [Aphidius gifuensis]|uniref:Uncharacterized protein n=2 Tax=Aphidius gifuensis TaxID=684658 RepID=A0A834Y781_APHGI|nr:hypothetical protein HCN44_008880 [Aphidius gifuensis]KAF7998438.1 hypothetical protein HCN44_009960 [Aphidius gifuensis]
MAEDNLSTSGCNATNTFPVECSALRENFFVMIKSHPCKIVKISPLTRTEVRVTGIDVLSSQKYEDICRSTMDIVEVEEKYYTLLDIHDGYFSLLSRDDRSILRNDLPLPKTDLAKEITAAKSKKLSIVIFCL